MLWFLRYTSDQSTFLVVRDLAIYIHAVNCFKQVIFYCWPHLFKEVLTDKTCTRSFVGFPFPYSASQFVQYYWCVLSLCRVFGDLFVTLQKRRQRLSPSNGMVSNFVCIYSFKVCIMSSIVVWVRPLRSCIAWSVLAPCRFHVLIKWYRDGLSSSLLLRSALLRNRRFCST